MNGFILLIGLFILEITLLVITIKTRNKQHILIRNTRTLLFSFLMSLIIFDVISLSFRYYGLLLVLLIFIVSNHLKSLNLESNQILVSTKSQIRKSIFTIILFMFLSLPFIIFPDYKPLNTTGIYLVETSQFVVEDNSRLELFSNNNDYRQVSVHAWYPKDKSEKFPLVIYSHGGISLETSNESLFRELASHGYVVFSIGHHYHSIVTKNLENNNVWINRDYMDELNQENAKDNPQESYIFYQKWMNLRTDDLNFIIDYTKNEVNTSDSLSIYNQINTQKIAMMGHSLGGSAALCLGRTRSDLSAVVALESPYMCDILGVEENKFMIDDNTYPVPVLNIYSDSSWNHLSIWPQYIQNNIMLARNDSVVVNIHIEGSGHFSLTDLAITSPIMTRTLNGFPTNRDSRETLYIINEVTLDFLNRYLK